MSRNREASGECMSKLQDYAVYRGPRLATLGLYKRVEKALQQRQNAIQIVLCSSRKMRALARPSPTELGAESRRGTAIVGKSDYNREQEQEGKVNESLVSSENS